MARKSRKTMEQAPQPQQEQETIIYKAGLYARLSVEDMRKKESDSIGTQKQLLVQYAQELADMQIVDIYEDINQTGTNFVRPGFNRLMDDIKSGRINCIVVKDLSRFGRNYIEAGNFIEMVFPIMGVRFIAINDNYDSLFTRREDDTVVPLKNLINDFYTRDISKKTSAQFKVKREKGEFCGSFAPYGYIKDGSTLKEDPQASEVVKLIFRLILRGLSDSKICDKLCEIKILPPNRYRYEKGILKAQRYQNATRWHKSAIARIAQNPAYTGNLVQGKHRSNFMQQTCAQTCAQSKKSICTQPDKWVQVLNTHPAIINAEDFELVQQIRSAGKKAPAPANVQTARG